GRHVSKWHSTYHTRRRRNASYPGRDVCRKRHAIDDQPYGCAKCGGIAEYQLYRYLWFLRGVRAHHYYIKNGSRRHAKLYAEGYRDGTTKRSAYPKNILQTYL